MMISSNLKIRDLLAGITPQPEIGQLPGISESVEDTDQGFAVILTEVVNGLNNAVLQKSDTSSPVVENSVKSEIEQSLILEPTTGGTASADNAELPAPPKSQSLVNVETVDILNQVNAKLRALPKFKTPVNNETVDIFNQSNSEPIVDTIKSPIKGLDLANSAKPEAKVQSSTVYAPVITIDGKPVSAVVNLPDPSASLFANDVLARLNLKEIHIKAEKTANDPVELVNDLITNINFAPKPAIEKSDATATQKSPVAKAEPVQDIIKNANEPETGDNLSKNHSQAPVELKTEETELLSAKIKTSDKFETVLVNEKSTVQTNIEQNANIDSKIWAGTEPDQPTAENKPIQSVKIILPEQTRLGGDNRNHSIVIKIEPEHLGPARLDLHLKNEILTAKLTVETPAAKTTLENSIHSLKEQFAKADIKVELIEINVRGETNHNQMFERQPQWQKFNSAHQQRFNASDFLEPYVPVDQINNFRQQQYVGSGGVNILA